MFIFPKNDREYADGLIISANATIPKPFTCMDAPHYKLKNWQTIKPKQDGCQLLLEQTANKLPLIF